MPGDGPHRHTLSGSGTSNQDWWPNQLNLRILHQHSAHEQSDGRGVRLRRGVQEARLSRL